MAIVALKAFGDLVIAVNCIERRSPAFREKIEILLGRHLCLLFEALETKIPAFVVDHGEANLPSLFTWKKDGSVKAMKSAVGLRRAVRSAGLPANRDLLFDHLGPRERFVTLGFQQRSISKNENIYLSYDRFFDAIDPVAADVDCAGPVTGPLRIFPGSRVPAKNLPRTLIEAIIERANTRGIEVELMLLDGERPDLEVLPLPSKHVPRSFEAMIAAVRGAGRIISADSMPAHIAEHTARPMFVFSPVHNRYWLPRAAFMRGWDALFDEGANSPKLSAFIDAALEAPNR